MFLPGDKQMEDNKKYFVEEMVLDPDWFIPRVEAVKYFNRDRYEKHLIDFINNQFHFDDEDQMDIYSTMENEKSSNEAGSSKEVSDICCHMEKFFVISLYLDQ